MTEYRDGNKSRIAWNALEMMKSYRFRRPARKEMWYSGVAQQQYSNWRTAWLQECLRYAPDWRSDGIPQKEIRVELGLMRAEIGMADAP